VKDGLAAAAVAVTLTLDDGRGALPAGGVPHTVTRETRLARAVARVGPLFERCRALLERFDLSAPVCGVAVAITATARASGEQGELLSGAWRDPAAMESAFARLRAELGPNVVVRPLACDSHRPERSGAWVDAELAEPSEPAAAPAAGSPPTHIMPLGGARSVTDPTPHVASERVADAPAGGDAERVGGPRIGVLATERPAAVAPLAVLRLLEAPEPVEVECAGGAPSVVWWRGRRMPVSRATGPERLSGDWWRDAYRRDYWRCEAGESEFVVYVDRGYADAASWYLHGWYD
jgi:hypothetical protein